MNSCCLGLNRHAETFEKTQAPATVNLAINTDPQ
jgi:hypothetical protein